MTIWEFLGICNSFWPEGAQAEACGYIFKANRRISGRVSSAKKKGAG
jgi:hypothetical protein